jgi:hypothetical protein
MPNVATRALATVFGVLADRRPYLATLYLMLAMPLGTLYFTFLAVGVTAGIGLTIIWVGLGILLLVLLLGLAFSAFERQQAIWLLGGEVGPVWRGPFGELGLKAKLKALLTNPVTWKGLLFLLLKFPLGLASFIFVVVAFSVSLAFLAAPIAYPYGSYEVDIPGFEVDSLPAALVVALVGFLLLVASLHAVNGFAWVWKRLSEVLLGNRTVEPAAAPVA